VIICHGIPGGAPDPNDKGYLPLAEKITEKGLCCILFNFTGCGTSECSIDMFMWKLDLDTVLDKVYDTPGIDPKSIHCIGFSAGGTVAAHVALYDDRIKSLMLLATPAKLSEILPKDPQIMKDHFSSIGLIKDKDTPKDLQLWYNGFCQMSPVYWIPYISPRPIAIVHGDNDTTVPVEHAKRLYNHASYPKEIIILEGATHQLRKDERITDIILNWLSKVV
jgi:pimeloyl-ACP methyl ester carboxylesterase